MWKIFYFLFYGCACICVCERMIRACFSFLSYSNKEREEQSFSVVVKISLVCKFCSSVFFQFQERFVFNFLPFFLCWVRCFLVLPRASAKQFLSDFNIFYCTNIARFRERALLLRLRICVCVWCECFIIV